MKKIHIFTHGDLDGVTSYLVVNWFIPNASFTYTIISNASNVREEVLTFLGSHSFKDYNRIFFLDLDCYDAKDLIEEKNVFIIDHHEAHFNKITENGKYENATSLVKVFPSCCLLIYKIFSKLFENAVITKEQKTLLGIVNDYDSYQLQIKFSVPLNWVFWSYNKKIESFINRFYNGFNGFNNNEISMIKIKKNELEKIISELELFKGKLNEYNVLACFADECINEVHDYILHKYKPDITIVIISKPKRVTWRKNLNSKAPLHILAEKLCDGGGHEYAAGGNITDRFLTFTKKLQPLDG
jgi:oligoribonuclease NrnB/cAMP/cGMP phosphodiesterase (DHH superfamily)